MAYGLDFSQESQELAILPPNSGGDLGIVDGFFWDSKKVWKKWVKVKDLAKAECLRRKQELVPILRYSNNGGGQSTNKHIDRHEHEERLPRAPSTAEQSERVAQEKAKHRLESQTVDKAEGAIEEKEEATIGDSSQFESIKEPV